MDWDDLKTLLAVAREGTLARAGTSMGVAHTTVGRRLRAAEASLGVRLFDRTPEGFVVTAAGQDLIEVAEQIEGDVLAMEGRLLGQDAKLPGPLRVSTMDLFFCAFPQVFGSFVERYPEIELTVTTELERVSLTRREADVVLRLTNDPPPYLVGRRVGRLHFAVYASADLVERVGADAPLSAYPWLGADEPEMARWLGRWLAEHAPGANVVLRVDDNARVRSEAIQQGIGVYFLPCVQGDREPGLARISVVQESFSHDAWLLTLRELRTTSRVRAFLDHATDGLRAAGLV